MLTVKIHRDAPDRDQWSSWQERAYTAQKRFVKQYNINILALNARIAARKEAAKRVPARLAALNSSGAPSAFPSKKRCAEKTLIS